MTSKKIIVAVTGSIAAYKAAQLIRLLVKQSHQVKVLMTPAACQFISPLTLSTLSKNEVHVNVIDENSWNNHVEMGLWADAIIIAPATANTIAKLATGICDNIISAVYLSAKCPVFIAPAMDLDMWKHPSTQNNIHLLKSYGNHIIDVEYGELASGLIGKGRMAEPENIVDFVLNSLANTTDLSSKRVLITAGPTYENIDPVRFIGNRSSGKMGISLAEECSRRGAEVTLVLGPTSLKPSNSAIKTIQVNSADEMHEAASTAHKTCDIAIFTAAVADYKVQEPSQQKIKKQSDEISLQLIKNVDIAGELGKQKSKEQIHIGFALETQNESKNALDKLQKKNFNLIVLNSLNDKGAGFQHDTNKITIFTDSGKLLKFELKSKQEVATDIINTLVENYVKV